MAHVPATGKVEIWKVEVQSRAGVWLDLQCLPNKHNALRSNPDTTTNRKNKKDCYKDLL
jgi:hypothetical protein